MSECSCSSYATHLACNHTNSLASTSGAHPAESADKHHDGVTEGTDFGRNFRQDCVQLFRHRRCNVRQQLDVVPKQFAQLGSSSGRDPERFVGQRSG